MNAMLTVAAIPAGVFWGAQSNMTGMLQIGRDALSGAPHWSAIAVRSGGLLALAVLL